MRAAIALCGVLAGVAACGGGGDCAKAYDNMIKCEPDTKEAPSKDLFVMACKEEKEKKPDKFAEQIECMTKDSCEEIKSCESANRDKRRLERAKERAEKKLADVKTAVSGGKYSEAMSTCEIYADERKANEEMDKLCKTVPATAAAELTKQVVAARDGGKQLDFKVCYELKEAAKKAGGGEEEKAKALCAEAEQSPRVAKLLKEVDDELAGKKDSIPYGCDDFLEKLQSSSSDWAKAKATEVKAACWVKLGGAILAAKVPGMKYCEYAVTKIHKAVKKFDVKDEAVDKLLADAGKVCEKQFASDAP